MAAERDPRVDPKAGDVLRKDGEWHGISDIYRERRVRRVNGNVIVHVSGTCSLSTWRKWAAKAEVIHRAD